MPFFTNRMDIFAHTLWTNMVFYKKYKRELRNRMIAVLFGVLPDLFSFTPVFLYSFFAREGFMDLIGKNIWVIRYAGESYNYTHSIIFFLLAVFCVGLYRYFYMKGKSLFKKYDAGINGLLYWPMFGWLLHILIDIPTHKNFYETPFLFPISDYRFSYGISWAHPVFMVINYSALALVYIYWFLVLRKKS